MFSYWNTIVDTLRVILHCITGCCHYAVCLPVVQLWHWSCVIFCNLYTSFCHVQGKCYMPASSACADGSLFVTFELIVRRDIILHTCRCTNSLLSVSIYRSFCPVFYQLKSPVMHAFCSVVMLLHYFVATKWSQVRSWSVLQYGIISHNFCGSGMLMQITVT